MFLKTIDVVKDYLAGRVSGVGYVRVEAQDLLIGGMVLQGSFQGAEFLLRHRQPVGLVHIEIDEALQVQPGLQQLWFPLDERFSQAELLLQRDNWLMGEPVDVQCVPGVATVLRGGG